MSQTSSGLKLFTVSEMVTACMGDCLQTGKPSPDITNTKVNSAFHPS